MLDFCTLEIRRKSQSLVHRKIEKSIEKDVAMYSLLCGVELCRDYNCDSTTIRLRSDYDVSRAPASIRREQKVNMSIFRRSRMVVESQL